MSSEFDPHRPIYRQIAEEIKRRTARGQYPPGSQLPSVRELAQVMGVNPNTLSRAYLELEREGFIAARRGQGSFVTEDAARIEAERRLLAAAACHRFVTEIRALGLGAEQVDQVLAEVWETAR